MSTSSPKGRCPERTGALTSDWKQRVDAGVPAANAAGWDPTEEGNVLALLLEDGAVPRKGGGEMLHWDWEEIFEWLAMGFALVAICFIAYDMRRMRRMMQELLEFTRNRTP